MEEITLLKGEKIKKVKNFPNYSITNYGRVLSYKSILPKWIKPQTDKLGYQHVRLYNDINPTYYNNGQKVPTLFKVHRLVADHFCYKRKGRDEVNHIDGVKTNNRADNLKWVNRKENFAHAWENGLMRNVHETGTLKRSHPVKITYKDGREIYAQSKTWAKMYLKCSFTTVLKSIKHNREIRKGYRVTEVDSIPEGALRVQYIEIRDDLIAWYNKHYPRKWSQL